MNMFCAREKQLRNINNRGILLLQATSRLSVALGLASKWLRNRYLVIALKLRENEVP